MMTSMTWVWEAEMVWREEKDGLPEQRVGRRVSGGRESGRASGGRESGRESGGRESGRESGGRESGSNKGETVGDQTIIC